MPGIFRICIDDVEYFENVEVKYHMSYHESRKIVRAKDKHTIYHRTINKKYESIIIMRT